MKVVVSEDYMNKEDKINFELNPCNAENQLLAVKAAGAPIPTWFQMPAPQGFENPKFPKEMVSRGSLWYDVSRQVYTAAPMTL